MKLNHKINWVLVGILIGTTGCVKNISSSASPIIKEYNGNPNYIEAKVEESFVIVLDTNPTTGYKWAVALPSEQNIIQFIKAEYKPDKNYKPRAGSGGREFFTFKTLQSGTLDIVLNYARPWETDKAPAEQRVFHIVVK